MIILPPLYNSLHRPILFGLEYTETPVLAFTSVQNVNGKAKFIANTLVGTAPCNYFWIVGGVYDGLHVVETIYSNGDILSSTDFNGTASGNIRLMVNYVYEIQYGDATNPFSESITAVPYWNKQGKLILDISRYLASTVNSPVPAPGINHDTSMNRIFRVRIRASKKLKEYIDSQNFIESIYIQNNTGYNFNLHKHIGVNAAVRQNVLAPKCGGSNYLAVSTPILFDNEPVLCSHVHSNGNMLNNVIVA